MSGAAHPVKGGTEVSVEGESLQVMEKKKSSSGHFLIRAH
jgi:hypothetical protein